MNTLVIYAHPNTGGHCFSILQEVKNNLDQQKKPYEVLDLYAMHYDPVLHEEEHYVSGNRTVSQTNQDIQKKIEQTDKIIFIFPVWWGSMPAILKGFIDRVFTSRWAYHYEGAIPLGHPKGKKALVYMTTGSAWWQYYALVWARPSMTFRIEFLWFCGIMKTKFMRFHKCRAFTEKRNTEIKRRVPKGLRWLYK